jgi:NTE family protein
MKIGLALSGGGALGAAHIGVVSQLENRKIKPSAVSGTSAGAIIGLLYSWGGLKSINRFFELIEERSLFGPKNILLARSPDKLFLQLEDLIREIVPVDDFGKLRVKFSCAVTNYSSGEAEVFTTGDPITCTMASSAYPGVFPIQIINGQHYVDGGVSLNMPVSPLREQGMEFIIASSIYALPKIDPKKTRMRRLQTAIRALEIMEYRINECELHKADFIFCPPVNEYFWYNFNQMELIRGIGETYAAERINDLPAFK